MKKNSPLSTLSYNGIIDYESYTFPLEESLPIDVPVPGCLHAEILVGTQAHR